MRRTICAIVLGGFSAALPVVAGSQAAQSSQAAQTAQPAPPPLASMTASRALVLPAQELLGAADARTWLARYDSVLTALLEEGGIGRSWGYARDALRYARQNPTYAADPRAIGASPLKNEKVREAFALPDPFASRTRMLSAIGNARAVIVPVSATLDSTKAPRTGQILLVIADPKASRVAWSGTLTTAFAGRPIDFADSLASATARLFVARQ